LSVKPDHQGAIEGLRLLREKPGEGAQQAPPRATVAQDLSKAATKKPPAVPALPELPRLTALPDLKAPASPDSQAAAVSRAAGQSPPLLVLPGDEHDADNKKKRPKSMVMMRSDFDVFRALPIFSDLSLDELKLVHTLADRVTFEPGQILIEQGQPGRALYVVASGKVKVELISETRIPVVAAVLGAGASIGEMAMVDEAPASARVSAVERVNAFCFPIDRLRTHLITEPAVGFKVMRVLGRILSTRLREANISMSR
jgi:CRP/FNR family cyclic AMP-dependent transcriptional regulator